MPMLMRPQSAVLCHNLQAVLQSPALSPTSATCQDCLLLFLAGCPASSCYLPGFADGSAGCQSVSKPKGTSEPKMHLKI